MGKIIVTEFVSLDGVIEDPGGSEDYRHGGWSFDFAASTAVSTAAGLADSLPPLAANAVGANIPAKRARTLARMSSFLTQTSR